RLREQAAPREVYADQPLDDREYRADQRTPAPVSRRILGDSAQRHTADAEPVASRKAEPASGQERLNAGKFPRLAKAFMDGGKVSAVLSRWPQDSPADSPPNPIAVPRKKLVSAGSFCYALPIG